MDRARFADAWNNFVGSSNPSRFAQGDPRQAGYIAKTFMALAYNGGLAFFIDVYSDFAMPDVIRALEQIGAGKAARELERALSFAGADPLVGYCESLSNDAEVELEAALNAHVSLYLDDYLRFGERQA